MMAINLGDLRLPSNVISFIPYQSIILVSYVAKDGKADPKCSGIESSIGASENAHFPHMTYG
jgi:hypothetical protein